MTKSHNKKVRKAAGTGQEKSYQGDSRMTGYNNKQAKGDRCGGLGGSGSLSFG